jgi:predicted lipid-binding transport protein (Tim44 family)
MRGRALVLAGALVLGFTAMTVARPGGGNSYSGSNSRRGGGGGGYSGGSSGYSGSSSSYGGGGVSLSGASCSDVLVLVVIIALIVGIQAYRASSGRDGDEDVIGSSGTPPSLPDVDAILAPVRQADPGFSRVLFEDFAFTLYAQAHRTRHSPELLEALAPYLTDRVRQRLAARAGQVQAVVVGALNIEEAQRRGEQMQIVLRFESNLHVAREGGPVTQLVVERWTLARAASAKTKTRAGVRALGCPSCGAPWKPTSDGRCESCGQVVEGGRFDWQVVETAVEQEEDRPHSLTGTAYEVGTDNDTVFQPFVTGRWDAIRKDDTRLTRQGLEARVRLIFDTMQGAWAQQDLRPLAPFVTERLLEYLQYWIDAYREQGLRNQVKNAALDRFAVARVDRDPHYDAVVLRVWGRGFDVTEDVNTGAVVGGSATDERRYTEYWTLVRSAAVRGAPRVDKSCPSCGAPLDVNMAGECAHCGTHLTSGEFDWVLSKIEQDEAYRG